MFAIRPFILNHIPSHFLKKNLLLGLDAWHEWNQKRQGYPELHRFFLAHQKYPLNLENPQTINQWIQFKKIHDRNPVLTQTSDKVLARAYVKEILGEKEGEEILIPVYQITDDARKIDFDSIPSEFFLKANHSSGGNLLVTPGMDRKEVIKQANLWLANSYGQHYHEWAYRNIPRKLICEKVLRDEKGQIPLDYKFYCIHGKVKMILFVKDRLGDQKRLFTDRDLRIIKGGYMLRYKEIPHLDEIPALPRMISIAEQLSASFRDLRVDLYALGEKVYFGELTHYDGSGLVPFDDIRLDYAFGDLLKKENADKTIWEALLERFPDYS